MIAHIEEIEKNLAAMKEAYAEEQKESYEKKEHKHFEVGEIVTDGNNVGVVGWTENKACGAAYEMGYMGIDLINGNKGFMAFAKRDEFKLVESTFYNDVHDVKLSLTGVQIVDLKYRLRTTNSSETTREVMKILNLFNP